MKLISAILIIMNINIFLFCDENIHIINEYSNYNILTHKYYYFYKEVILDKKSNMIYSESTSNEYDSNYMLINELYKKTVFNENIPLKNTIKFGNGFNNIITYLKVISNNVVKNSKASDKPKKLLLINWLNYNIFYFSIDQELKYYINIIGKTFQNDLRNFNDYYENNYIFLLDINKGYNYRVFSQSFINDFLLRQNLSIFITSNYSKSLILFINEKKINNIINDFSLLTRSNQYMNNFPVSSLNEEKKPVNIFSLYNYNSIKINPELYYSTLSDEPILSSITRYFNF